MADKLTIKQAVELLHGTAPITLRQREEAIDFLVEKANNNGDSIPKVRELLLQGMEQPQKSKMWENNLVLLQRLISKGNSTVSPFFQQFRGDRLQFFNVQRRESSLKLDALRRTLRE